MEHDGRGSSDNIRMIKMDSWSLWGGQDTPAIIKHITIVLLMTRIPHDPTCRDVCDPMSPVVDGSQDWDGTGPPRAGSGATKHIIETLAPALPGQNKPCRRRQKLNLNCTCNCWIRRGNTKTCRAQEQCLCIVLT